MEATTVVNELADRARSGARTLIAASASDRSALVNQIANALEENASRILAANESDLIRAKESGMQSSMVDRLLLTADRIKGMADGARQVAALPNPLNKVINERTLPNGLQLKQVSVPFGVVGMVYEARPNVTVDAAAILIKSGNAALLRGSSSASSSNAVLIEIMREVLAQSSISPDVIQNIPSDDRSTVAALLHARGKVDLVIPRGSAELIRRVVDDSSVPTIETGAGVCHVYVDEFADLDKALPIVMNSKTHRPSVCNAAETLLVHNSVAEKFLPTALLALIEAGVTIHADGAVCEIAKQNSLTVSAAEESHWSTEYNALEMNVAIVPSLIAAADHIQKYGTQHTEAIVTENVERANQFIALSDCAAVMVNASTRFTDGEQMGFGAEIGISNQKLHARGPMGLEQMTTTTWIVWGTGQIR
jgi:glutamate-5-semialdehyde dehydrogenase